MESEGFPQARGDTDVLDCYPAGTGWVTTDTEAIRIIPTEKKRGYEKRRKLFSEITFSLFFFFSCDILSIFKISLTSVCSKASVSGFLLHGFSSFLRFVIYSSLPT